MKNKITSSNHYLSNFRYYIIFLFKKYLVYKYQQGEIKIYNLNNFLLKKLLTYNLYKIIYIYHFLVRKYESIIKFIKI